jgi:hypothetical protein
VYVVPLSRIQTTEVEAVPDLEIGYFALWEREFALDTKDSYL